MAHRAGHPSPRKETYGIGPRTRLWLSLVKLPRLNRQLLQSSSEHILDRNRTSTGAFANQIQML